VEVLRLTGIRIEELAELSHHSLIQYRLPATGELIPLLQIAPSKTDEERLLVIGPELADVLATIVARVRDPSGAIPLVSGYDRHEKVRNPPMPLLFQWRSGLGAKPAAETTIRHYLAQALSPAGITSPSGEPLYFTPHDFRRLFITDAKVGRVALDATFIRSGERLLPGPQRGGCIAVTGRLGVATRG
jgi:integrase